MKQTSLLILFALLISQLNSQNIYTKEEILANLDERITINIINNNNFYRNDTTSP